jgi:acetyl esterase/lipase
MITPGGGYVRVVVDKEGYELARWLADQGFTVFVLFYRLPGGDDKGWDWASGADTPLCDAQRAMRLIRHHAPAFGIEPRRVAAIGFSAGGMSAPIWRRVSMLGSMRRWMMRTAIRRGLFARHPAIR